LNIAKRSYRLSKI